MLSSLNFKIKIPSRKKIVQLLQWNRENYDNNYRAQAYLPSFDKKILNKYKKNMEVIANTAEEYFLSVFHIKRYSVIRCTYNNGYQIDLLITDISFRLTWNDHNSFGLELDGIRLRNDGSIGKKTQSIHFYYSDFRRFRIERRLLDGSWHSIIPANYYKERIK